MLTLVPIFGVAEDVVVWWQMFFWVAGRWCLVLHIVTYWHRSSFNVGT